MKRDFKEALLHRRSYYQLSAASPVSDAEITDIVNFAVKNVPSAFNSQSTRVVLLLHEHHAILWEIVKKTLQNMLPADVYVTTQAKIDGSFASGYGTILFFEDQPVVDELQRNFPLYADKFPVWSQHTSAMHQLAIWTMLEDAGFGASLQHYNPLIDQMVHKQWALPETWQLVAQMPFGLPAGEPGAKEFNSLEERIKIFG